MPLCCALVVCRKIPSVPQHMAWSHTVSLAAVKDLTAYQRTCCCCCCSLTASCLGSFRSWQLKGPDKLPCAGMHTLRSSWKTRMQPATRRRADTSARSMTGRKRTGTGPRTGIETGTAAETRTGTGIATGRAPTNESTGTSLTTGTGSTRGTTHRETGLGAQRGPTASELPAP